jgi:hypothetical protein
LLFHFVLFLASSLTVGFQDTFDLFLCHCQLELQMTMVVYVYHFTKFNDVVSLSDSLPIWFTVATMASLLLW